MNGPFRLRWSVGPGEGDVTIDPTQIVINGLQGMATFKVSNEGDTSVQWYLDIANNTSGQSSCWTNHRSGFAKVQRKPRTDPRYRAFSSRATRL